MNSCISVSLRLLKAVIYSNFGTIREAKLQFRNQTKNLKVLTLSELFLIKVFKVMKELLLP